MFLAGPAPGDLHTVFRQTSNSAVAFRLGPGSYHAISRVHRGERYTVIYTFLTEAASDAHYRWFPAA